MVINAPAEATFAVLAHPAKHANLASGPASINAYVAAIGGDSALVNMEVNSRLTGTFVSDAGRNGQAVADANIYPLIGPECEAASNPILTHVQVADLATRVDSGRAAELDSVTLFG